MAARQYTEEEHKAILQRKAELFSIPEEKRFLYHEYKFEGIPFLRYVPPENIAAVRNWTTKDDDIFISTYPKSGTHWVYEIVQLILSKGYPQNINRSKMLKGALEMMQPPDFKKPTHVVLDAEESPRIILSHLPWQFLPKQLTKKRKGKVIYVMRNLKDVITSQYRFWLSGVDRDESVRKYLINVNLTGDVIYGSWFDHVHTFWRNRNQMNVFFTSYEQLKKDFRSVVRPLANFLGQELDEEALDRVEEKSSLKEMKKTYDDIEKNVPGGAMMVKAMGSNSFIQKGAIGSWKHCFTVADNELFDQVCKEKMANWDLEVVYE